MIELIIVTFTVIVILFLITMLGINKDVPEKRKASKFYLGLAIGVVIVIALFGFYLIKDSQSLPKVVETYCQPQIDTNIIIIDGKPDTTYIYTFPNFVD